MASSVVTKLAKKKMVQARAGMKSLPIVTAMAFGNGAVSQDGSIIDPSEDANDLINLLLTKEIDRYEELSETSIRYYCTLNKSELVGKSINEVALVDADGDLLAIKTFSNKGKDPDMEMVFEIDDMF